MEPQQQHRPSKPLIDEKGGRSESLRESFEGEVSSLGRGRPARREKASRSSYVRGVQILPPRGEVERGRSSYRLHLVFDSVTDPSSLVRQTGTVSGVEIEVEEKELQPLARLTGRQILIHYLLWAEDVEADAIQAENSQLKDEISHLRRKLQMVQDQLQFTVEQQVREQRG
jgi:hypothetical protein